MDASQRLQQWWKQTSADIVIRPTPAEKVQELERHYGISLPDDFKHYVLTSCPQPGSYSWDSEDGCWWYFDRIKNIPDEYEHEIEEPAIAACAYQCLFFLDHLIWSSAWAIVCTNDQNRGKVVWIGGQSRFVADSFSDFVERYTTDWASVSY